MQFFKRLEIHGFKSFANKTVVEFHPGVTVIVGPNGCGKSNVFDSIRWVLGEQSAKSLRGSRMGDVIFNGSGGQKAMGMAKVGIVLNNTLRHLPLDFDEVEISRRLFRTGESEYGLNKTTCRLKDITSTLMDTGIGTDSYSVLEQGKVDAIINSKPLERRAIFDEAAGISKYKARKDEALNKMNRTEDDLTRLHDLIGEVQRQCNSLKRQANKAERYRNLAAELKTLEMELLVRRYYAFRESSASSEANYRELAALVAGFRAELQQIDEDQLSFRSRADEAQLALEETQQLNFELAREAQETQGRIALLQQRQSGSAERRQSLELQIQEFEQTAVQLADAATLSETEADNCEADIARQSAELEEASARYETLKRSSDSAATDMVRLRNEISAGTRARMEKDNEIRVARVMEEKLHDELGRGAAEIELLQSQLAELDSDREAKRRTGDEAEERRESLTKQAAEARELFKARDLEHHNLVGETEQARRAAHECQSRHDALAELQANFEGYFRGVKEVMAASQRNELKNIIGVVTTLIEAKPEHELAIETALGGQAQDIVVETAEAGKAAIQWLKQSRTGRATFLPLDLIEGRDNNPNLKDVLNQPGVIGFATNLVKYEQRLQRVVQYLLGNVIVVRDLDTAVALVRRGIRTKFVTLEGESLSAHGAMTGGNIKAAGLLNRAREVKELASRLEQLRTKEHQTAARAGELKSQLGGLRENSERLSSEAQKAEIEAARTRKDFEAADHRAAEKTQQFERIGQRRETIEQEITTHRATQAEGSTLLDQLTQSVAELEQQLQGIEAHASSHQQEVAESGQLVNDLRIALSAGTERLKNLRERAVSSRRERERLVQSQGDKQEEVARLEEQDAGIRTELVQLGETLAGLQLQQQQLTTQLSEENQRKETVQHDLRGLTEKAQTLQRDLNEAQNEFHELELKRTEYVVQLENISIQAHEKFGMLLDEVILAVLNPDALAEALAELAAEEDADQAEIIDVVPAQSSAVENAEASEDIPEGDLMQAAEEEHRRQQKLEALRNKLSGLLEGLDVEETLTHLRQPDEIAGRIQELRGSIEAMGPVHVGAIDEYNDANQRLEFLTTQEKDLVEAKTQLSETIAKIDETTKDLFTHAFAEIRQNFEQVYRRLFGGGRADLLLTEAGGILDGGIDIIAQPPGKKPQHISLLSGGEKALTAISLLFAIFMRKPSPFCILDEIDAPLDDKNIERFKDLVHEFADTTQFIIITHNKQTMQLANTIYGVTMEEQGVSRIVSIKLDEIDNHEIVKELEAEPVSA